MFWGGSWLLLSDPRAFTDKALLRLVSWSSRGPRLLAFPGFPNGLGSQGSRSPQEFQGAQGKARIREKRPKRASNHLRIAMESRESQDRGKEAQEGLRRARGDSPGFQ